MRYRVWIHDSSGIHTPSHPIGSRRAAEVFAAHRARFRRDCFVIVCAYSGGEGRTPYNPASITGYRNGRLCGSKMPDPFNPECAEIKTDGAIVFALTQKASML